MNHAANYFLRSKTIFESSLNLNVYWDTLYPSIVNEVKASIRLDINQLDPTEIQTTHYITFITFLDNLDLKVSPTHFFVALGIYILKLQFACF